MNEPRQPFRKSYEDGMQIWRTADLKTPDTSLEWLDHVGQILMTPEGKKFFLEHPRLFKTVMKEIARLEVATVLDSLTIEQCREFIHKEFGWEYKQSGVTSDVYLRRNDHGPLAIKRLNPSGKFDSDFPSLAVQTGILRLLRSRFQIDTIDTYVVTPQHAVIEYVDAPLTHHYLAKHPEHKAAIRDEFDSAQRAYDALREEFFIPEWSDIKQYREDTSNSFVIVQPDGQPKLKFFDLGFGSGYHGFPFPDDDRIIHPRPKH